MCVCVCVLARVSGVCAAAFVPKRFLCVCVFVCLWALSTQVAAAQPGRGWAAPLDPGVHNWIPQAAPDASSKTSRLRGPISRPEPTHILYVPEKVVYKCVCVCVCMGLELLWLISSLKCGQFIRRIQAT